MLHPHCNRCLKPTPLPYRCYRCNGWYCKNNRLPKNHNRPEEKRKAEKDVEQIKPEKEKKKKMIITQIPYD